MKFFLLLFGIVACTRAPLKLDRLPFTGDWDVAVSYANGALAHGKMTLALDDAGVVTGSADGIGSYNAWKLRLSNVAPASPQGAFKTLNDQDVFRYEDDNPCVLGSSERFNVPIYAYANGEPVGMMCLRGNGGALNGSGKLFGTPIIAIRAVRPLRPFLVSFLNASWVTSNILGSTVYTMLGALLAILAAFGIRRGIHQYQFNRNIRYHLLVASIPAENMVGADHLALTLYCQIVRFGSDPYLEKIASEDEKKHGRLLNRVVKGTIEHKDGKSDWTLRVKLPVHRGLGTQFSLFLQTRLGHAKELKQISNQPYFVLRGGFANENKLFFRLSQELDRPDCAVVKNVEGFCNNFFYPTSLPEFTENNEFNRWS